MLKLVQLTKTYPGESRPALSGIDLEVKAGEFVAVLGRSGAGKSTLIRCINRLIPPTSGQVIWKGRAVHQAGSRELLAIRSEMGMIFQHFNLIPRLDVLTNVLVGRFHCLPLWRCLLGVFPDEAVKDGRRALERVGIGHLAHRRVEELSGGQQQRVAIARVLVQRPHLLLGDEPVASLDPVTATAILDLLKEIHAREGMTTILNLHDVELAKRVATRVIGIARGRIVFDGSPERMDTPVIRRIYQEGEG